MAEVADPKRLNLKMLQNYYLYFVTFAVIHLSHFNNLHGTAYDLYIFLSGSTTDLCTVMTINKLWKELVLKHYDISKASPQ